MISRDGNLIRLSGDVTINTVNSVYRQGLFAGNDGQAAGELQVDCSGLGKVDSSAVSLMLSWVREAQQKDVRLGFSNVPESLRSLAKLYGVAELIDYN